MKRIVVAGLLVCLARPAPAMTAAELLQDDSSFSAGYVFGIIEYSVTVGEFEDKAFMMRRQCLLDTKANAATFLEITKNFIRRNPSTLKNPASGAVLQAVIEMCGKA
ncbi:hypothetical protein [Agrobacterium tumefaciens]|uniref:Rap1a immunity protein domain-containing protein n=1 Tax=Agrobacterium tumefaciens TaxID=358 RepID=A0A176X7Z9_AGRTU|nr:hypothetical protein [Agrobacterium tumefaciens]OAE43592.1 hypothetical protein A7J57_04825 [Agrobacterium tumefaciens]